MLSSNKSYLLQEKVKSLTVYSEAAFPPDSKCTYICGCGSVYFYA